MTQEIYVQDAMREGKRQGRREGKIELAKSLLELGVNLEVIAKGAGLTPPELDKLIAV